MTTSARFGVTLDLERAMLRVHRGSNAVDVLLDSAPCVSMGAAPSTPSDGMTSAAPLIRDLPIEILGEIFLQCHRVSLAAKDITRPLRLSQVCRYFRQVAFSNPQLWRSLQLDDRRISSEVQQAGVLDLWLRNSGACSYSATFCIRDHPERFANTALHVLRGHTHRLRKLKLVLTDCPASLRIWSVFVRSLNLDYLKVSIDPGPARVYKYLGECSSVAGVLTSPHQRAASLPVSLIPPSSAFSRSLSHMVYLKLHDFQQDKPAAAARILDFLSLCPALQVFDFCGLPVDVRRSAKQTVHLPVLRVMHLRETCVGRDLLTHMHMPALEELHMSQLNVAFVGINGYQESGDSDDEAGDFSRSPYSDRLTGMMMRSLFRRCNPPLRVLDFDYVDMRTKDFLWCFAHMPHLEEFRIVASDMSDTVIDALGEPLDDEENWPLPRLRHLVLRDCNMIRGAVVGRMITARSVAGLLPAHYDVALCERVERRTVEIGLEDVVSMVGLTVYVEDVPPKEEPSMDAAVQEMHNMEE